AGFLLKGKNGLDRIAAGAAVDAVGLEALLVEPALDFLDLLERRPPLAAGELLVEWRIAADQVAEMAEREGIAGGGVVAVDCAEILPDEERRPAAHRRPQFYAVARPGEGFAVGARNAEFLPLRVAAPATAVAAAGSDLAAPRFAAAIAAALDEIARGAGERVVGLAEGRGAPVVVVVDAHVQPHLRHPLGVAHRAGPGADHLGGLRPAPVDDGERIEQLGFPVGAPARLAESERGERRNDRPHVFRVDDHVAERGLHAP